MNKEEFIKYLEELNIYPTDDQLIKLDKFYKLLITNYKSMFFRAQRV